jgi:hypothetical protein
MTREQTTGRRTAAWFLTVLFGVATAALASTDADLTRAVEKRLADEEVVGFNVMVETSGDGKSAQDRRRGQRRQLPGHP